MRYCGIDGSTSSTGIAIFDDKNLIFYDCIAPKSKDCDTRIKEIASRLSDIFDHYRPEQVFAEDVPLKDGKPTIKKLSTVRGVILTLCELYESNLIFDSVAQWRHNAGFFGGSKDNLRRDVMKARAIAEVKRLFNIEVNDDTAEAILIGYRSVYPI